MPIGISAAGWTISSRLLAKSMDFVALIILARLLSPADFGLVAIAMTVILIVEAVFDVPVALPILRLENPDETVYDTAFTLGLLRAVSVALILLSLAWPMARYFQRPELWALVSVLSLAPVMRGLVSPRMVRFTKKLDFRREFLLEVSAKALALILAVGAALRNGGYWSIVVGTLTTPAVMLIMSYLLAPGRWRFCLHHWPLFREVIGWGMLNQLLTASCWQGDRLLMGRTVAPSTLGAYTNAANLVALPTQAFTQPINRPLTVLMTNVKDNPDRARIYAKGSGIIVFICGPILLAFVLFPAEFILGLLGEKWKDASPLLRALAACALVDLMTAPFPALTIAYDRVRYMTGRVVTEIIVKFPVLLVFLPTHGVDAAIYALLCASTACLVYGLFSVRSLCRLSVTDQFGAVWRIYLAMALVALGVSISNHDIAKFGSLLTLGLLPVLIVCTILMVWSTAYIIWALCGRGPGAEKVMLESVRALIAGHSRRRPNGEQGTSSRRPEMDRH